MATSTEDRKRAETQGRGAESRAAFWLRLKGYRIIARRARTPAGEIDLIAAKGRTLVFIEVKARASLNAGRHALTPRQQARITRAAEAFVRTRPDLAGLDWRFDLIALGRGWRFSHLKDAWRPGLP
ncbi:MAG: YraN family protein [Rhodospirillales bacterium]